MRHGILKFFNFKNGFGFIEDTDTGEQFFVMYKSLPAECKHKRIRENSPVAFEVSEDKKHIPEEGSGRLRLAVNISFETDNMDPEKQDESV